MSCNFKGFLFLQRVIVTVIAIPLLVGCASNNSTAFHRGAKKYYSSLVTRDSLTNIVRWPLAKRYRITSLFGYRKSRRGFHEGIDIAAPKGTPVYAAHSGRVVRVPKFMRGYGKAVAIEANEGFMTVYAHLNSISVKPGMLVKRGRKIGYVGQSGNATGPHLHFEIRIFDPKEGYIAVDPLWVMGNN